MITAVGHLSPYARTRIRPAFEIDRVPDLSAKETERHIGVAVSQVAKSWGSARPLLLDLPDYGPEHRVTNDLLALQYAFLFARQAGLKAVPVRGPVSARGAHILQVVRDIARRDRCGAALRIPFAELSESNVLQRELSTAKSVLELDPADIDILLDFETISHLPTALQSTAHLTAVIHEALAVLSQAGNFRNVVLCGSSVPESVGKEYNDAPYRGRRVELDVWRSILPSATIPVSFSDTGITPPRGPDPRGFGPWPARVRLSTPEGHVFYRRQRRLEYRDLCAEVVSTRDFDGEVAAWGAAKLRDAARGYPASRLAMHWVAYDTNYHLEATAVTIERLLRMTGHIGDYRFPPQESFAWFQTSIPQENKA